MSRLSKKQPFPTTASLLHISFSANREDAQNPMKRPWQRASAGLRSSSSIASQEEQGKWMQRNLTLLPGDACKVSGRRCWEGIVVQDVTIGPSNQELVYERFVGKLDRGPENSLILTGQLQSPI